MLGAEGSAITPSQADVQRYLAYKKQRPPWDPTVTICPGPYGSPRGGSCFVQARYPRFLPLSHLTRAPHQTHLDALCAGAFLQSPHPIVYR